METLLKKDLPKEYFFKNINTLANTEPKTEVRMLKTLSDEALVGLFQKGDVLAFQILLERYKRPLFNFFYKSLGQHEAAEEAFQETFLKLIKAIDDYKPAAKFSTWLYTIARNFLIDQKRKNRFRQHLSLDESTSSDSETLFVDQLKNDDDTAEMMRANEIQRHLNIILKELNPEQREVFILRELQGLPFDEIARVTHASLNTVKSRMRYALQAIQKRFVQLDIKLEN